MATRAPAGVRSRAALLAALVRYSLVHRRKLYRAAGRRARETDTAFLSKAMSRFTALGLNDGASVVLLNETWRTHDLTERAGRDFRGVQLMRLTEALKQAGFFADAELLLAELTRRPAVGDLALLSWGDLRLTMANWSDEFEAYEAMGAALDGYALDDVEGPWRGRRLQEAVGILQQAASAAPSSPHAQVLLLTAENRRARRESALTAARTFDRLQHGPAWDERMAQAAAALPRDHDRAVEFCEAAIRTQVATFPDGGFDRWEASVRPIRDMAEIEGAFTPLTEARAGVLEATLVRNGVAAPYRRKLAFPAAGLLHCEEAVVLPPHGMILAHGALIGDSGHILPRNFPVFTPDVRAVADGHAVVCGPAPVGGTASGAVLIGQNANYYHFLIEELPRLQLVEADAGAAGRPLIVDEALRPWQLDLLRRLGYAGERLVRQSLAEAVRLSDVVIPGRLSTAMLAHPDAVAFIRARLAPHADAATPKPGKRLYLSRPTTARRGLLNERQVAERMVRAGFTVVDPGALSIDEQIEMFADVEVMAGPGGAAFTNLIFAPRGARALLITPADVPAESFTSIASSLGQKATWCAGVGYSRPHASWIWSIFDFEVDLADVDKALEVVL